MKKRVKEPVKSARDATVSALLAKKVDHWVDAPSGVTLAIHEVLARPDVAGLIVEALKPYRIDPVEIRPHFSVPVYEGDEG